MVVKASYQPTGNEPADLELGVSQLTLETLS